MEIFRRVRLYEWVAIGVLLLGAVVWAVRLEARVDQGEIYRANTAAALEQIRDDLSYIRGRLDRAVERTAETER